MRNLFYFVILAMLLLVPQALAYTISLSDADVLEGQTLLTSIKVTAASEKNDPYTVYWYKADGTLLETDTGFMSEAIGGIVFETYNTLIGDNTINGNLSFDLNNDGIDAFIYFNITESNITLIINDAKFSPSARIGDVFAIDFEIVHEDNKTINNAECIVYGTDINEAPLQSCTGEGLTYSIDGRGTCDGILANLFTPGEEYLAKVRCKCGIGDNKCFDEDGVDVEKHVGSKTFVFVVDDWLSSVNTITDKTNYVISDKQLRVCANVTNNQTFRIPLEIYYNYRCGTPDNSTERVVVDQLTEVRGISSNTTQNQCALLNIKNLRTMLNKENVCYAATEVRVLSNTGVESLYVYSTTSEEFNITSNTNTVYVEDPDKMTSLSITIFILFATIIIFLIPKMYGKFSDHPITDLVIRRCIYIIGFYLMVMNSAIISSFASSAGFATSEIFRYMWLFGVGGYILIVVTLLKTLFDIVLSYNKLIQEKRGF